MDQNEWNARPTIEIRHLANSGFLISGHGRKILVDGLYGKAPQGFSALPVKTREALIAGEPPFDGITYVLVSHYHPDHYDTETVRQFLQNQQPEIWLPDEELRVKRLEGLAPLHPIRMQMSGDPASGAGSDSGRDSQLADLGDGDTLSWFITRHSGLHYREMRVICFIVNIAGRRLLFLSDADFDPAAVRSGLSAAGAALAGQTAWAGPHSQEGAFTFDRIFANPLFLDLPGGREILFEILDAEEIVVTHIPLKEDDIYDLRSLPKRCIEAYSLPREKIRLLTETDEVLSL